MSVWTRRRMEDMVCFRARATARVWVLVEARSARRTESLLGRSAARKGWDLRWNRCICMLRSCAALLCFAVRYLSKLETATHRAFLMSTRPGSRTSNSASAITSGRNHLATSRAQYLYLQDELLPTSIHSPLHRYDGAHLERRIGGEAHP